MTCKELGGHKGRPYVRIRMLPTSAGPSIESALVLLSLVRARLLLVLPSEGLNAVGMRRVSSPYYIPIGFILLTVVGVTMAAFSPPR